MSNMIFTVGHSTHSIEQFLLLLRGHHVTAVADVRSHPYSRFNPQFNREALKDALERDRIQYVFIGDELGARAADRSCYVQGKVQYDRLARTPQFQSGLERVIRGSRTHTVAMMCAEKDPLTCHRAILVARHLASRGVAIQHILDDGSLESHADAISRLLVEVGLPDRDLFRTRDELIEDAYRQRGEQIAYTETADSAAATTPGVDR